MSAPITEERLAEIEARASETVVRCDSCSRAARFYCPRGGGYGDWACAKHADSTLHFSPEELRGLDLDALDLVAEVRRLTAALEIARREGAQAMRDAAIAACNAIEDRIAASREGMRRSGNETLTAYQGRRARAVGQAHGAAICAMEIAELALPGDAPAQDTTKETDR